MPVKAGCEKNWCSREKKKVRVKTNPCSGQFMNSSDLTNMFKAYVKTYEAGTDDVVYKHFGK